MDGTVVGAVDGTVGALEGILVGRVVGTVVGLVGEVVGAVVGLVGAAVGAVVGGGLRIVNEIMRLPSKASPLLSYCSLNTVTSTFRKDINKEVQIKERAAS